MPSVPAVIPPIPEICARLKDLQHARRFCIKQQSRTDRAVEAFLARNLGYHSGLPEDERSKLMAMAQRMRRTIEQAGADWRPPPEMGQDLRYAAALVLHSRDTRQPFDQLREQIEADMRAGARQLPVWPWVQHIRGVAELGLAVVVGEAGDLGNYSNPGKLWKRLGLAVIDGERQQRIAGDPDKAIRHGYNAERRAEIWAFFSDTMFRQQWRGERDDVPAHPNGPYGEVYIARKEWTLARGWTVGHAHNDARRFMTKTFLRDLWEEWQRAASPQLEPEPAVAAAAELPDAAE